MINCKLFTGRKCSELVSRVSQSLQLPLGNIQIFRFENGEFFVRYLEDIEHKCVLLILEVMPFINESIVQFLQMIDAARQAKAERIIVILPFYPYARQDRALNGSGISSVLLSRLIKAAGADLLITVDLHNSSQCKNFEVPTYNITLEEFWLNYLKLNGESAALLVAADKGMKSRVEYLACKLNCSWGYIDKRRNLEGEVESVELKGDVSQGDVYLIDDLIDTGKTLSCAVNRLKASGARKIVGVVTHGIVRETTLKRLQMSALDALITTDTLPTMMTNKFPTKVVSIAEVLVKNLKQFLR